MPNDDASEAALSASQHAVLSALLDTLIPASGNGEMPSAAEVGFEVFLATQARDFVPELLAWLEELGPGFADLSAGARTERVTQLVGEDPARFAGLLARVYDCYYQHDVVRERIGVVRGAVFPQGNEVVQGDLSLLDPVIENADRHRYRTP